MKRRIRNIILSGTLFGGILLMLRFIFRLSEEMVWKYYIIASIIILVGAMGINIIWQVNLMKKLKSFEKYLKEEGNPDKFIEENEKLLQTMKSDYNRTIIKINLSAGYCDKEEYETAKNILLSEPIKQVKGINKVIYYINLAYIYFRLEENQKALSILEQQKKEFSDFEKNLSLGGHITVLKIFQNIAENQLEEAQNLLTIAKDKWDDKRLLKDWEYLQTTINQRQHSLSEDRKGIKSSK